MKMKITPNAHTVRTLLELRIDGENKLLAEDETALAKLNNKQILVHNPYEETEKRTLLAAITTRKQFLAQKEDELTLMRSHEAPKVLVEIDI